MALRLSNLLICMELEYRLKLHLSGHLSLCPVFFHDYQGELQGWDIWKMPLLQRFLPLLFDICFEIWGWRVDVWALKLKQHYIVALFISFGLEEENLFCSWVCFYFDFFSLICCLVHKIVDSCYQSIFCAILYFQFSTTLELRVVCCLVQ